MFSELYLDVHEKIENIHCIKLIFELKENKIIPSKKCTKIIKNDFIEKLNFFIKNFMKKNKNNYNCDKNKDIIIWYSNIINYFKTKKNLYEDIKNSLNDCLILLNINENII